MRSQELGVRSQKSEGSILDDFFVAGWLGSGCLLPTFCQLTPEPLHIPASDGEER